MQGGGRGRERGAVATRDRRARGHTRRAHWCSSREVQTGTTSPRIREPVGGPSRTLESLIARSTLETSTPCWTDQVSRYHTTREKHLCLWPECLERIW
jgi:hypothetical protein